MKIKVKLHPNRLPTSSETITETSNSTQNEHDQPLIRPEDIKQEPQSPPPDNETYDTWSLQDPRDEVPNPSPVPGTSRQSPSSEDEYAATGRDPTDWAPGDKIRWEDYEDDSDSDAPYVPSRDRKSPFLPKTTQGSDSTYRR